MARKSELPLAERWARLERSLGAEILTDAYSEEDVNDLIRDAGGDPEGIDRRSIQQARDLWKCWQNSSADKQSGGKATSESESEVGDDEHGDISQKQLEMGLTVDKNINSISPSELNRSVDPNSQREQHVRMILEDAGAIQREYDYGLPCKLHSDTHIDIGKLCESEEYLEKIVSALDETIGNETVDTIVSNGWPVATIARRLVLRRIRRPPRIRHVKVEGYNPPNVLDEIKPGARAVLLLDVVATGSQATRLTQELQRQKARSVKIVTIVDADFLGKRNALPIERLCRITMELTEPGECERHQRLPLLEFNPIAGRMTKKKPPRSPSEFLEQDSAAREFWEFVNIAGAFEHHRIVGKRHYFGFVDTVRLLQHPATREPILENLCHRIQERSGIPDVVLVPKRVRGELIGKCLVQGFSKFLGASGLRVKHARQKRGCFIVDDIDDLSGRRVLVADAAAGHGDTLDELTLLSITARAASVAAAVLLSRLSEGCEKAFDKRLTGHFVRLYSMPVRPITVRDNSRINCPVCQRRQNLRVAIAELPEGSVRDVAKKLVSWPTFRRRKASVGTGRQLALFSKGPLSTCRRSVASGVTLHALHAAMNDGMAPLSLPEITCKEYSVANRAALLADLPAETLTWSGPTLLGQLREVLKKETDKTVWKAIVEFMYRSQSADWVECLGDAIENAEITNQWMDNEFWAWMMLVVNRLVRDKPEIGDQMQPELQTLAQTYVQQPVRDGLRGMLTAIRAGKGDVVLGSDGSN